MKLELHLPSKSRPPTSSPSSPTSSTTSKPTPRSRRRSPTRHDQPRRPASRANVGPQSTLGPATSPAHCTSRPSPNEPPFLAVPSWPQLPQKRLFPHATKAPLTRWHPAQLPPQRNCSLRLDEPANLARSRCASVKPREFSLRTTPPTPAPVNCSFCSARYRQRPA